jgi:hypothetical protein
MLSIYYDVAACKKILTETIVMFANVLSNYLNWRL